jgi:hypothetical protein
MINKNTSLLLLSLRFKGSNFQWGNHQNFSPTFPFKKIINNNNNTLDQRLNFFYPVDYCYFH